MKYYNGPMTGDERPIGGGKYTKNLRRVHCCSSDAKFDCHSLWVAKALGCGARCEIEPAARHVCPLRQQTESSELCVPLGQGRFPLFAYFAGDGLGLFQHISNKLVFRAKRMTLFTAQAGVGFP